MQGPQRQSPFKLLGQRLKLIREKRKESLAEASGAVEIDADMLERIENGEERPSEEILMLLINHFAIREQEAVGLWECAGYDQNSDNRGPRAGDSLPKPSLVVVALDTRAVYSDGFALTYNENGVILNFTQTSIQSQPQLVSRVGMSNQQAEVVLRELQRALLGLKYLPRKKMLPPGSTSEMHE